MNRKNYIFILEYFRCGRTTVLLARVSRREWAYDRGSVVGGLDAALDQAVKDGWVVVDMKGDWKVVYPFELGTR